MKTYSVAGDRVVLLLTGAETNHEYTVMEATLPPGAGPPPHVHSREDETFLTLRGEVTFHLGEKTISLKKGEFLFAPRGIPHYFKNTGAEDAVLLETASPAGIENFFIQAGKPLPSRDAPPLALTPDDVTRLRALAPDYGLQILTTAPH
jgi:quercetin dioxygenase-like cupin family protein